MQRRDKQLFETNLRRLIRSEIRSLHEEKVEETQKTDEKTPPAGGAQDPLEKGDARIVVNKLKSAFATAGITLGGPEIDAIVRKLIDDKNKPNTMADFGSANVFEKILTSESDPGKIGAAVKAIVAIAQELKNN